MKTGYASLPGQVNAKALVRRNKHDDFALEARQDRAPGETAAQSLHQNEIAALDPAVLHGPVESERN